MDNNSFVVVINMSGVRFEVKRDVLMKIPWFVNTCDTECDLTKEIKVYRSPLTFQHILSWAIDDRHSFPKEYMYELDFYLIDIETVTFIDHNVYPKLQQFYDTFTTISVILNNKLVDIKQNVSGQNTVYNSKCFSGQCNNIKESGYTCCNKCRCKMTGCKDAIIKDKEYCELHSCNILSHVL